MAVNIFDKYGIKEVANVYFEALANEPASNIYKGDIVLYLDTLKVSTIEQTAEQTDARGGWGNPKLITWDYGKEITITLEDALMSLESLRFMMGGAIKKSSSTNHVYVHRSEQVTVKTAGVVPLPTDHITLKPVDYTKLVASPTHPIRMINYGGGIHTAENEAVAGSRTQMTSGSFTAKGATVTFTNDAIGVSSIAPAVGDVIRIFWDEDTTASDAAIEVTISPDTFPGTYRVVGDTFMRSQKTGKDEPFQFVIEKAKVSSEVTLTLEAEGDPTTFNMTLTVLRAENADGQQEMMKLVRYGGAADDATNSGNDIGSLSGVTSSSD